MRIFIAILSLALLASCEKKKETPPKRAPLVKVATAKEEKVHLYNTYVGRVEPLVQVDVTAQVEGVLTGYYFTEGDEVKQGDLLFTIDARPYEAQLAKAEAALAQSIVNLRYAQDVAKRNAKLAEQDYVSRLQYDQYVSDVMAEKALVAQNEAEIETAKINISYCNIHAPVNAVTGKLQIDVGNLITNASTTPIITLNQITPAYVYFSVPQKDLPHIMRLHRESPLRVEAYLNEEKTPFTGELNLIDNEVDDKTGSIWLRGLFPNKEKLLWPGEFTSVRLYLETLDDAVIVPSEAISTGQKGKYAFVIGEDNVAELREVTTGRRIENTTIITSGVQAGERVVIEGQINLSSKMKVQIKRSQ